MAKRGKYAIGGKKKVKKAKKIYFRGGKNI